MNRGMRQRGCVGASDVEVADSDFGWTLGAGGRQVPLMRGRGISV